jgi:hypothetical protein
MEFYEKLATSTNEKDVENNYREFFNRQLKNKCVITSPYGTDGHLKYKSDKDDKQEININCLFEFKYEVDFTNKIDRSRVIIQALYYLKKFEEAGEFLLPTTLFIGDKNECFYFHTNKVLKYLGYNLDWKIAPSEAGFKNPELLKELSQDSKLEVVYIINIDKDFKFMNILKEINKITLDVKAKFRITQQNVQIILNSFLKKVLDDKNLSVNEEVNLFIQTLIDRTNNYQHPNKPNVFVTKGFGNVKINGAGYKSFMGFFDTELSPSEKETLTASQDRLIEDETRRMKGEFYTPTMWVNEAHKMISNTFGENWKEEYVVWDPASGTGNLTRDYKFKELYCSTLNESDIETMIQSGYNPEATKFQYDFLNDGIIDGKINVENDNKLPEGLKKAILEGKKIIVLMNPPYGRSNGDGKLGTIKKGSTINNLSLLMKNDKIGGASSQLYTQFLYKILKIKEKYNTKINISIFAKSLYLSGNTFKLFRNIFLNNFEYINGMLFKASYFDSVSDKWGIDFSIWKYGKTIDKINFNHVIKDVDDTGIIDIQIKNIYNLDKLKSINNWINYKNEPIEYPTFTSALSIKECKLGTNINKNSFSSLITESNNIMGNSNGVYIINGGETRGKKTTPINNDTLNKATIIFCVRKSFIGKYANWINDKDEYIAPTQAIQQTSQYKQFESDSIVYSLFNTSSNQSSMRQVEYKEKLWDIKNEFFFMSKDEMLKLANDNKFDELYKDARMSDERYVYNLLKTTNLSTDALDVLETARELVRKTFEWRKIMHQTNPEYHLHAWDAGWYQIKKILNEHFKEDLKIFTAKYKKFEDRMRPQVYELGFLKA